MDLDAKMQKRDFLKKLSNLRAMVSIDDLGSYVTGLFKKPIIRSLKSKMAEIRHLENRHDVIFSAEGGPIWIKFRRLVQNDVSTAVMLAIVLSPLLAADSGTVFHLTLDPHKLCLFSVTV